MSAKSIATKIGLGCLGLLGLSFVVICFAVAISWDAIQNRDATESAREDTGKTTRGQRAANSPKEQQSAEAVSDDGDAPDEQPATEEEPKIEYEVVEEDTLRDIKRSLTLRLKAPVSKDVLRRLANKLHAEDPDYERTFIVYLLPGMEVNAGAWATTHINPDLEVELLGPTVEEYERLQEVDELASGEALGSWLNQRTRGFSRITIYGDDGQYFKKETYKDGSSSTKQLLEHESTHGQGFAETDAQFGEHYVITVSDNLQIRGRNGVIATALPNEED